MDESNRPPRAPTRTNHPAPSNRDGSNRLLTVRECAERLGVSEDYIRDRIGADELRALRRIGRGYRVRVEWLDDFLARRVSTAVSEDVATTARSTRRRRPTAAASTVFTSSSAARRALVGKGDKS